MHVSRPIYARRLVSAASAVQNWKDRLALSNKTWQNLQNFEDVIKCCIYERWRLGSETIVNKDPAISSMAEQVCVKLQMLHSDASIPTVSKKRVLDMIHAYRYQGYL